MQLITNAAVALTSPINSVLDIGCGAGNNTLKLRQVLGKDFAVDLLDLSQPMLTRASQRVAEINHGSIKPVLGDFRDAQLDPNSYDVIFAAAVLHHLRDDTDWLAAFEKVYRILTPGGSVWITGLVSHKSSVIHEIMWTRYAEYLTTLGGE